MIMILFISLGSPQKFIMTKRNGRQIGKEGGIGISSHCAQKMGDDTQKWCAENFHEKGGDEHFSKRGDT